MKRNVDLTDNRDFQKIKQSPLNLSVHRVLKKSVFPWSTEARVKSGDLSQSEIILTGNAMQRKQKRESNAFDLSCQCCGRKDSFYQTITKSTLCKVCDELLENDSSNKFPWSGFEK